MVDASGAYDSLLDEERCQNVIRVASRVPSAVRFGSIKPGIGRLRAFHSHNPLNRIDQISPARISRGAVNGSCGMP